MTWWKDRYLHGQGRVRSWTSVPSQCSEDRMLDLAVEQSLSDQRPIIAYTLLGSDGDEHGPQLEIGIWGKADAGYVLYNGRWNGISPRDAVISLGDHTVTGTVTYRVDVDWPCDIPASAHIPLDTIRTVATFFAFHPGRPRLNGWSTFPRPPSPSAVAGAGEGAW